MRMSQSLRDCRQSSIVGQVWVDYLTFISPEFCFFISFLVRFSLIPEKYLELGHA